MGAVGAAADVHRITPVAPVGMAEDAEMIVVVGIGADGMAGLAPAAPAELTRGAVVFGSRRPLDLLDDTVAADRPPGPAPVLEAPGTPRATPGGVPRVARGGPA